MSTSSAASLAVVIGISRSSFTRLADSRQLLDTSQQPVEHAVEIPAGRIVETASLPDSSHGRIAVPIEIGIPEAGSGIPVGLGRDAGMPRLVRVADHGARRTQQLPLDEVGNCNILCASESGITQRPVERLGDVQDVGTNRKSCHVVVQQPWVSAVDSPGFSSPLLNPLPPRQLRVGDLVLTV